MDLENLLQDLDKDLQKAIQSFWNTRREQGERQAQSDRQDQGARSEVTGGAHMKALESVVASRLERLRLPDLTIQGGVTGERARTELPGFYRPEKAWDMVVLSHKRLVATIEFKSQVGPSFGNNANNRAEEAIGNGEDIRKAIREERFGKDAPLPFIGYVFLLEDCPAVHSPVSVREPFFVVDPVFKKQAKSPVNETHMGVSYAQRYETLCRRLRLEGLYTATCLILATKGSPTRVTLPAEDLSFRVFMATLLGHAAAFAVL
ncbi:MAG: PaeR7I family type II restriction endonuclease [Chloroflexota bacterium]